MNRGESLTRSRLSAFTRSLTGADVRRFAEAATSWLLFVLGVGVFLSWELAHRGVFAYAQGIYPVDDADEWRYTACSRLVEHGYALFAQVFSAQPPLLFASLSAGMRLFGDSIGGARWVELGFGLVSLACSAWIAWMVAGHLASGATTLLLAVSPGFLIYSHTIEAEGPMMALMTLSLALALGYAISGRQLLPLLAGLALAAAMLMKLFAVEAALPGLWLILCYRPQNPLQRLRGVVLYVAGAMAPLGLNFALLYPRQQWDQVIRLHERAAQVQLPNLTPPGQILGQFLSLDLGLTLLAAAGFIALLTRLRWREAAFVGLWLVGNLVMLYLFRPLFPHHAAILLTPLAVSAGVAVGLSADRFGPARPNDTRLPRVGYRGSNRSSGTRWRQSAGTLWVSLRIPARRPLEAAALGVALLAYVILIPRIVHDDRHALSVPGRAVVRDLAGFVRANSSSRDIVALDDLAVADAAHRLVPPPLCDPSNVRLRAGYLTPGDLVGSMRRYRPRLVVPSFGIFQQVPPFIGWLRAHYRSQPAPHGTTAYFRR